MTKEKAQDNRPPVTVVAIAAGYFDGYKNVDDVFQVPASFFDKREKLDAKGQPNGEFHEPPSWFVEADVVEEKSTKVVPKDKSKKGGGDLV